MCNVLRGKPYINSDQEKEPLGSVMYWVMTSLELHTVVQQLRSKHNRFKLL